MFKLVLEKAEEPEIKLPHWIIEEARQFQKKHLFLALTPWKESYDQFRHHIKKQRHYFANKGPVDSLEKTLMLGGIGGRRRRGQQRMRWLDGITDSMDMSLGFPPPGTGSGEYGESIRAESIWSQGTSLELELYISQWLLDHLLPHLWVTSTPHVCLYKLSSNFSLYPPNDCLNVTTDWLVWGGRPCGVTVSCGSEPDRAVYSSSLSHLGRGGTGSIYVWASGDGGSYDDCNCDGYASIMWTIYINSAINDGRTTLYHKSCSSTLAFTFNNGRKRNPEAGVATPDLYGNCTLRHSGTSAAAPEAAGVFALALEAKYQNQLHNEVHQWRRNWVGLEFDHLFGYGVLDTGAMVKMAKDWKTVPERFHCVGSSVQDLEKILTTGKLVLTLTTDTCEGKENFVHYLEHVQAVVTVNVTRRGDLNINMMSPMCTKSIPLSHAPQKGVLKEWTLLLHGSQSAPYIDQVVWGHQSKMAMSKKEELEEELEEVMQRSLKSILGKD
ncbi:hypothetical protein FD755_004306 [Muntiacus reevesi]|uniref:Neuroendocrine convertase 2 n=1 Tax=Muntiacus reevesi TaxID=9886 RepID=A0A5J5MQ90_MUNRE|nr:hypothetical protein FD755_004306 [Muntiacus reevesi]